MRSKRDASAEKLAGRYFTPPDVAELLARWVQAARPQTLLEPAVGEGAFLEVLAEIGPGALTQVTACEVEPATIARARASAARLTRSGVHVHIHSGDFLAWALDALQAGRTWDAFLGNPPYIRYQFLSEEAQGRAATIFQRAGVRFTKHTNAWVPFVIAGLSLLRPGGRLAVVVPTELLHVLHAQGLRDYLRRCCAQLLVLDPEDLLFPGLLQGTVLLLAEKRPEHDESPCAVMVKRLASGADLALDPAVWLDRAAAWRPTPSDAKWMTAFLDQQDAELFSQVREQAGCHRLGDLAEVDVGVVTGANPFFLVPRATVQQYGLDEFARPMFGRSEHVAGLIYDADQHLCNRERGLPTEFLEFPPWSEDQFSPSVQMYLATGVAAGLPDRYKCRIRNPWYTVPSVWPAPIALLKRAHHFPRLILNSFQALTTDTAYRVRPKAGCAAEGLVFSFLNSLTLLSAELEGRHYGGGVLELVPSEIERLCVPWTEPEPEPGALDELQRDWTNLRERPDFWERQDARLLGPLGLTASEQARLRLAWHRMQERRCRTAAKARSQARADAQD